MVLDPKDLYTLTEEEKGQIKGHCDLLDAWLRSMASVKVTSIYPTDHMSRALAKAIADEYTKAGWVVDIRDEGLVITLAKEEEEK